MPTVRHLPRAPIREALLDVRISRPASSVMNGLRELGESLPGFRETHTQFYFEGQIQLQEGVISREDRAEPLGFRVASEDGLRVVQLRVNGFSFSRLEPYTSWEEIRAEAGALLDRYVEVIGSNEATRIALRYVNHLRLPYPTPDLTEFVVGLPDLPSGWPNAVESFLYRVTLAAEAGASVNVTHALVDDVDEDRIGVIFDIDAFREGRFAIGDDLFWRSFEELRELKNRIFFRGITEQTVEMYT